MKTARYWARRNDGRIECRLCPHRCVMDGTGWGRCRARGVEDGELKAAGYGLVSSAHTDPIEKKPLYHFLPGTEIFSVGGWGCNFRCAFCQNWSISQHGADGSDRYSPGDIISAAAGSGSVAYTYNEPLINIEFVQECAAAAKERGLANVLVTNGYVEREPASELLPLIDALNIDVKSMDDGFYRQYCGGSLEPVLSFARQARETGCHVEITNLIIPGLNDSDNAFETLARWVRDSLGGTTPLHLSAYSPQYKMTIPPTGRQSLERAYAVCSGLLPYVFLGNVAGMTGSDTHCPSCGSALIKRSGYAVDICGLEGDVCAQCGRKADVRLAKGI